VVVQTRQLVHRAGGGGAFGGGDVPRGYETLLLNLATGQATQIVTQNEFQHDHVVSSNRELMAYRTDVFTGSVLWVHDELVIATADGQRQVSLPWEEDWRMILGWTDDQRLLIELDEPVFDASGEQVSYISYLVLDPRSGERQLLQPDFPSALDLAYHLYWPDHTREIYNPTLTRAIYLRTYTESNEDWYTFAIWDIVEQRLVASLESIYGDSVSFSGASPLPRWSPDGSQFVVRSQFLVPNQDWAVSELFRVSQEGQVEQLTHLNPFLRPKSTDWLAWSPDGQNIALVLSTFYGEHSPSAAVLNLDTLEITDYCIPVRGLQLPAPVWSPDGTQFLIVDEYTEGHRRIILVDIVQGFAVQIAEDMEILGWMVMP
jgi:Tol biopolymer transport system component